MAKRHPKKKRFVICVSSVGYRASLEPRKIYVAVRDAEAKRLGMLRVIDESGEDYLFPPDRFVTVELPRKVTEAISRADAHA
jgi:hypothetical protein